MCLVLFSILQLTVLSENIGNRVFFSFFSFFFCFFSYVLVWKGDEHFIHARRSQSTQSRPVMCALIVGNNEVIFRDYYYTFFPPQRVAGRALLWPK